jgi:hypothetical protein
MDTFGMALHSSACSSWKPVMPHVMRLCKAAAAPSQQVWTVGKTFMADLIAGGDSYFD